MLLVFRTHIRQSRRKGAYGPGIAAACARPLSISNSTMRRISSSMRGQVMRRGPSISGWQTARIIALTGIPYSVSFDCSGCSSLVRVSKACWTMCVLAGSCHQFAHPRAHSERVPQRPIRPSSDIPELPTDAAQSPASDDTCSAAENTARSCCQECAPTDISSCHGHPQTSCSWTASSPQ